MPQLLLTGIKAVIFDLDDTLYSERQFAFSGFDAVADLLRRQAACPFDPAQRMRELFETPDRTRVFDCLLREMGVSASPEQVAAMVACYRHHEPRIRLYPDAERSLTRWRQRFKLGVISDGYQEVQQRKVAALGLPDKLDAIILTDAWGREFWKPHPRAFETMQQTLGSEPAACIYLADNPAKDFVAPRRLGWQTVQVARRDSIYAGQSPPPGGEAVHTIASLDDLELTPA